MPLDPIIPGTKHGLIALTNHLNTTNLTFPHCDPADPGHRPTLLDCTRAVNVIRFSPMADHVRVWTAVDAYHFRASSDSCQVLVISTLWDSEDSFALIEVAEVAVEIMAACFQAGTGTTLGGQELVGSKLQFGVVVAYVEPNQNDE